MPRVLEADTLGRAKGVCVACGKRQWLTKFDGDSDVCVYCTRTTKRCPTCGLDKPLDAFKGNQGRCSPCFNEYRRQWQQRNPDKVANYNRKHAYGLTEAEYQALLLATPCCPLCQGAFEVPPHVDHDHKTGRVRGLLCGPCNRALGLFGEDVDTLVRAINYLRGN